MSKEEIRKALSELVKSSADRKNSSKLEEVFQDVEDALNAGVSRQKVLDTLNAKGIEMTLKTFNNAMYRLRKKYLKKGQPKSEVKQETNAARRDQIEPASREERESADMSESSHNPKALDDIINSTPDLDALTRLSGKNKRNSK